MKKIAAALCTLTLLVSFSACGVEKPDLESVSEKAKSTEGSSAKETEKKALTRKDSHIKGDLAKNFHVDVDIQGEKTSLPTYYLSRINLTEEQLAEKLMSSSDRSRNDKEDGVVVFTGDKEKLVIDLDGKGSNPDFPSPNLTYGLDKGKEYEAVVKGHVPYESLDTDASKQAVAKVREILDKLPIEYSDDFKVEKMNYDFLNDYYSMMVDPKGQSELPDEIKEQFDEAADMRSDNMLLLSEGKDAKLDKDFKFGKDDGCFIVTGNMKVNDMVISGMDFRPYSITAAVSSRGVEFLFIEDLYIPDNGSTASPIVTPEQAAEAVYKDFESSTNKDKYEAYINGMSLTYTKELSTSDTSKTKLRPVWKCTMSITNIDHGYATTSTCEVYADTGEMVSPYFQEYSNWDYPESSSESEKGE